MTEKKSGGFELNVIFFIFMLICLATLVDIIPGINGSIWAVRLYGIVCLIGVIFCARKGLFMAIDSFVLLYPESLQKTLSRINQILMLIGYVLLEAALVIGFRKYLADDLFASASLDDKWNGVLYVLSLIVYPVSLLYLIREIFRKGE
ncbi:MAG: hypothetical protein IJM47_08305 [Synergistaceae bacterium]|nr:hypothetical protein [Synergistaceae bacterium]MBQ6919806.1 hypothetical protein [Synergistaceae bacterium]MBQ7267550.1 hypothetical protein [Synergistaceae bacterium]MBQ9904772.1 hypothetical protein [Synergistaceae bacterium]